MILIEDRCLFDLGRSRDRFPIVPALEIDTFLDHFNCKSILVIVDLKKGGARGRWIEEEEEERPAPL